MTIEHITSIHNAFRERNQETYSRRFIMKKKQQKKHTHTHKHEHKLIISTNQNKSLLMGPRGLFGIDILKYLTPFKLFQKTKTLTSSKFCLFLCKVF